MKVIDGVATISISIYDLLGGMNEDEKERLINYLACEQIVLDKAVDLIENDWSGNNCDNEIHKARKKLLDKVKMNEIGFYAKEISEKVEKMKREEGNYFKAWHWLSDNHLSCKGFPETLPIDFDYKEELEKIIKQVLTEQEEK